MNIQEFKDQLITDGIASIKKHETRQSHIDGGIEGFELCRNLNTMEEYQKILQERRAEENRLRLISSDVDKNAYWKYRYTTIQIEYVFDRLCVIWSQTGQYDGPVSARAVLRTAEIVGVADHS
jgi:hypothetical protein